MFVQKYKVGYFIMFKNHRIRLDFVQKDHIDNISTSINRKMQICD